MKENLKIYLRQTKFYNVSIYFIYEYFFFRNCLANFDFTNVYGVFKHSGEFDIFTYTSKTLHF